MAWRIDLDRVALRELDRLDLQISCCILAISDGIVGLRRMFLTSVPRLIVSDAPLP